MNSIISVTPSNIYDENKMKYLLESAKINNFKIEIIGLNKPFTFLSKIILLKEYLENLPTDNNSIICFTDAYDVFYLDNLETIKNKFLSYNTDVIWSVERWYSHQLQIDKAFYDNISTKTSSPYKYINTGTFIGFKNNLLYLLNDINISINNETFLNNLAKENYKLDSSFVDQTIISHHLANNWNKYNIKLDYNCDIFYIPCDDWNNIDKYINNKLINTITNKSPSIIHVPWKKKYEHILIKLFNKKYNPLINKKYSWHRSSIVFLENGLMNAFGKGTYTKKDPYTFEANFGRQSHIMIFNDDYTKFTSTRKHDNEIIKGILL